MTPVLAFDVNETLLDLAALDPVFESVLGDRGAAAGVVRIRCCSCRSSGV